MIFCAKLHQGVSACIVFLIFMEFLFDIRGVCRNLKSLITVIFDNWHTYLGFNLQIMFYHFSNYLHISYNNLFIRKKNFKNQTSRTYIIITDVTKCSTHFTVNFVTKVTLWTIWHEMLPSVKIGRNRSNKFSKNDIFFAKS